MTSSILQEKNSIDHTVSTCTLRDSLIWKKAASNIIEFIDSKNYFVIVPKDEVSYFRKITPSKISVIDEESLLQGRNLNWIRENLPCQLSSRAGWYYQQFLKIDFLNTLEHQKIALIWDADTVPLKNLEFIDEHGRLIFRLGTHHPRIHEPYFNLIESLLQIKRIDDESFISQCMPVRTEWVHSFCKEFDKPNSKIDWVSQILEFINHQPSPCGFSEYETLGNYFRHNFQDQMYLQHGKYCRPANFFNSPDEIDNFPFSRWKESQEYLAFDSYLADNCTGLNIGCGNTRMVKAIDGGQCINIDKYLTAASDVCIDLENGLPFKNHQFKHIIAHNILEHVNDLYRSIEEIDRILAPGGILQIEVPHIGSYNHGTDITHRRGLTFDSFNFLISKSSYLFPSGNSPFKYRLLSFNRENIVNNNLIREYLTEIPQRGTYQTWIDRVLRFDIPGTFGYIFQKID